MAITRKKHYLMYFALCFFSLPTFAITAHPYLGGSLAASFSSLGTNTPQIAYSSGATITDAYPLNHNDAGSAMVSINGGYEFPGVNWYPAIAIGLGLYTNPVDSTYKGKLIETAAGDPSSTLYNYHYDINSTRLMAEAQLTWLFKYVSPFLHVGIGPAWNRMSGYNESVATPDGFVALPPFSSKTNTNFAYQLGFGLSTAFNFNRCQTEFLQERISVGYRYVNLGETSFGTRGTAYPHALHTGRLTMNDVYLSYVHLF